MDDYISLGCPKQGGFVTFCNGSRWSSEVTDVGNGWERWVRCSSNGRWSKATSPTFHRLTVANLAVGTWIHHPFFGQKGEDSSIFGMWSTIHVHHPFLSKIHPVHVWDVKTCENYSTLWWKSWITMSYLLMWEHVGAFKASKGPRGSEVSHWNIPQPCWGTGPITIGSGFSNPLNVPFNNQWYRRYSSCIPFLMVKSIFLHYQFYRCILLVKSKCTIVPSTIFPWSPRFGRNFWSAWGAPTLPSEELPLLRTGTATPPPATGGLCGPQPGPKNEEFTTEDGVIWGIRGVIIFVVSRQIFIFPVRHHQITSRNIYGNWGVGLILPRSRRLGCWCLKMGDTPKLPNCHGENGAIYSVLFVSRQLSDKPWWYIITHNNYIYIYISIIATW